MIRALAILAVAAVLIGGAIAVAVGWTDPQPACGTVRCGETVAP